MKIRPTIFLLCAIAVLVVILAIVWPWKKPLPVAEKTFATNLIRAAVPEQGSASSNLSIPNHSTPRRQSESTDLFMKYQSGQISPQDYGRELLDTQNDVPIVFYGKLEDQFANPVTSAEVKGVTSIHNSRTNGYANFMTMSDANGLFELDAGRGAVLSLFPQKTGYALATTGTEFKYSHMFNPDYFVCNSNNPVIIKMWKLRGAEHLIHFNVQTYIPIDGTPATFDLETGQRVTSGGDIIVADESPSSPHAGQTYDWKAGIRAQNGGLALSQDDYGQMFQAPEASYDPELIFDYKKDTTPWQNSVKGMYYFTSRGGEIYGKLTIDLSTYVVRDGGAYITLTGYLNPGGSRNLEIDPTLVTEAHP